MLGPLAHERMICPVAWYIYLHEHHILPLKTSKCIGKYTIHGWYGCGCCKLLRFIPWFLSTPNLAQTPQVITTTITDHEDLGMDPSCIPNDECQNVRNRNVKSPVNPKAPPSWLENPPKLDGIFQYRWRFSIARLVYWRILGLEGPSV